MKILTKIFTVLAVFFFVSCSAGLDSMIGDINGLAAEIEKEGAGYTESDWEKAGAEFEGLCEKIQEKAGDMTAEQQTAYLKAIGRYSGACMKSGMQTAAREAQKMMQQAPAIMEGFMKAFEEED